MPVFKMIFRLDFDKPKFSVVDNAGAIMQMMTDNAAIPWIDFRNEVAGGGVSAHYTALDSSSHQQITIQPANLNFLLEDSKGIDLSRVELHQPLADLFKIVHAFNDQYHIAGLKRAGIRFVYLSDVGTTKQADTLFESALASRFLDNIKQEIGAPNDYGIAINGIAEDKLGYNFKAGPLRDSNIDGHFAITKELLKNEPKRSMMVDLDFFEENFVLSVRGKKWSEAAIRKAQKLTAQLEELLLAVQ